jgi:hypothetical protein
MTPFIARQSTLLAVATLLAAACGPDPRPAASAASLQTAAAATSTTDTVRPDTTTSATASSNRDDEGVGKLEPREADDVCRFTDERSLHGRWHYGERYDPAAMQRGVTLRCPLRRNGPEVRLVVRGESAVPTAVAVYSPADASAPLQTLAFENDEGAYEGSPLVVGRDLDGDGWTDLSVMTWYGSGGAMYEIFRYDPRRRRFARDDEMAGVGNVRPLEGRPGCVRTSWASGAFEGTSTESCRVNGVWTDVKTEETVSLSNGFGVHTVRELRGGKLVVVRVDTARDGSR